MNILFLSTRYPYPPDCGHYLRTYHTVRYLAQSNQVFFLSFLEKGEINNVHPEMQDLCALIDTFFLPEDASKFRFILSLGLNVFSSLPFVAQKYYDKRMKKRIVEIIKEEKIDLVHVDMLPLARYLNDISAKQVYLVEHNVEYLRVRRAAKIASNPLLRLFLSFQGIKLKKFEKKVLPQFKEVFCVSDADAHELKLLAPEGNYKVVPNAVDIDFFKPGHRSINSSKFLWVGGARELYNRTAIEFIIKKIYPLVQDNNPDIKFSIVGDSIKKYFPDCDECKGIDILGYVDEVRPYFDGAAAFVAPIFSGSGTKLKILNAMAMSLPVITTKIGIEGIEYVESGVHYLAAETAIEFYEQIMWVFNNPRQAAEIGQNGLNIIHKHYIWDTVMKAMDYSTI